MPRSLAIALPTNDAHADNGDGQATITWWQRCEAQLRALPQWLLLAILLAVVGLVGWVDYVAPWEFNLALVYATIILLAAWLGGSKMGLTVALISAAVTFVANMPSHPYQTVLGLALANLSRVVFFVCMAICVGAIRSRQQADASRIRMLEEVRQLEQDIVTVAESEQQRIGQDLHDGLCQQLAAISCAARALADDLQAATQPTAADAIEIEKALSQSVMEARSMARGIFPVHVDATGLATALGEMVAITHRLTGVSIVMTDTTDVAVPEPEVAMHLYRIAQEAVANAVRHSGASQVIVSLIANADTLELRIDDNGKGIPANALQAASGMGLRTMRYRARSLGATLDIQARAGGGTSLCCKLNTEPSTPLPHGHN